MKHLEQSICPQSLHQLMNRDITPSHSSLKHPLGIQQIHKLDPPSRGTRVIRGYLGLGSGT